MIGILIVAHGNFGESLIQSATHVLGARPLKLEALAVEAMDSPEVILQQCRRLIATLDDGAGVLVIGDICGATPCNVATRIIIPGRVEVLTGANLPMLLRALTYRHEPLASVVAKALAGGAEGVFQIQAN